MNKSKLWTGTLTSCLLTTALTSGLFFMNKLSGTPFVPFAFFDWITRTLPGDLVTFGIDLMIDTLRLLGLSVADTAKTAEQIIAILEFIGVGVLTGLIFFWLVATGSITPRSRMGLVIGTLFGLPMVGGSIAIDGFPGPFTLVWLASSFLFWGLMLSLASGHLSLNRVSAKRSKPTSNIVDVSKRQFLINLGTATAAITFLGTGIGTVIDTTKRRQIEKEMAALMVHEPERGPKSPSPISNNPFNPAPGTRPEYTPLKDHYKVSIRIEPTEIDGDTWTLPITGDVDNPLMLTLDDIRSNYKSLDQYVTLNCISGRLGTDLISTTLWTGVSLQDILANAKVLDSAKSLFIESGDGFYESVDLELIASDRRIMLVYAWDGNPIGIPHGFPLRIWIPDKYGMKQPKWITNIEVLDEIRLGYWVERGWDPVAQVNTVSVVDTIAIDAAYQKDGQTFIPVGGIAFAGDRGISNVEISEDNGPWKRAQLGESLSETTWVLWRYDWPFESGHHTFAVRSTESDGTPQIADFRPPRPSGATGIHTKSVRL